MTQKIDTSITKLKSSAEKQRELITGINDAIENDAFVPSESQQMTIDYICHQGQLILKEIKKLNGNNKKRSIIDKRNWE